jgi:membrane fusion protein, multidrug efflux system
MSAGYALRNVPDPPPLTFLLPSGPAGTPRRGPGRLPGAALAAIPALAVALFLAGCGKETGTPVVGAAPAPPPVAVTVLQVAPQRVPVVFDTVGQTEGAKQVEVRARVSGILQKQLYKEGDAVAAGAPLFQIDRAPFEIALAQARAQAEQDKARTEQTKREEGRLKPLADDRAISRKEYDDALSAAQLAAAQQQQSAAKVREAELNLSYTLVSAPVAGVTGRSEHSEGTLISTDSAGSLLTTINQVNPIWVRFSLAQSDLAKIPGGRLGSAGQVDVQLMLPDGTRFPGKGRLNFAATAIDTRLGTLQLRAEFDNARELLLPGQFVRVQITAGARDGVFLVPQSAVMQTEKAYLVFVVDPEGKAALRTLEMGEWVGSDWMVLSGLKAGDRIIVDNLLKVRPGAAVTPNAPAATPPNPAGGAPAADKSAPPAK